MFGVKRSRDLYNLNRLARPLVKTPNSWLGECECIPFEERTWHAVWIRKTCGVRSSTEVTLTWYVMHDISNFLYNLYICETLATQKFEHAIWCWNRLSPQSLSRFPFNSTSISLSRGAILESVWPLLHIHMHWFLRGIGSILGSFSIPEPSPYL